MAKFSIGSAGLFLAYLGAQFKSATLVIYSGTQPATPETALSGNTSLATFTFTSTPFSSVTNSSGLDVISGNFASTTVTPSNNGTAVFARVTAVLVSSNAGAWTTGTAYTINDIVTSNSSYWMCVKAGTSGATAPTGSTSILGFSDGSPGCAWSRIGPTSNGLVIGDFTVGVTAGSFDVIVASTTFSTSVNQTLTSFQFTTSSY